MQMMYRSYNFQIAESTAGSLSSDDEIVPTDGQWANTTLSAINASQQEGNEDDFYRHSTVVTTVYCLACKQNFPST